MTEPTDASSLNPGDKDEDPAWCATEDPKRRGPSWTGWAREKNLTNVVVLHDGWDRTVWQHPGERP